MCLLKTTSVLERSLGDVSMWEASAPLYYVVVNFDDVLRRSCVHHAGVSGCVRKQAMSVPPPGFAGEGGFICSIPCGCMFVARILGREAL